MALPDSYDGNDAPLIDFHPKDPSVCLLLYGFEEIELSGPTILGPAIVAEHLQGRI